MSNMFSKSWKGQEEGGNIPGEEVRQDLMLAPQELESGENVADEGQGMGGGNGGRVARKRRGRCSSVCGTFPGIRRRTRLSWTRHSHGHGHGAGHEHKTAKTFYVSHRRPTSGCLCSIPITDRGVISCKGIQGVTKIHNDNQTYTPQGSNKVPSNVLLVVLARIHPPSTSARIQFPATFIQHQFARD